MLTIEAMKPIIIHHGFKGNDVESAKALVMTAEAYCKGQNRGFHDGIKAVVEYLGYNPTATPQQIQQKFSNGFILELNEDLVKKHACLECGLDEHVLD